MTIIYILILSVVAGIICFATANAKNTAAAIALLVSSAGVAVTTWFCLTGGSSDVKTTWLPEFGASFHIHINGLSAMLCLLTCICFVLIILSTWGKHISSPHKFYGLMLLSLAGLLGVFVAYDALLFYIFWELALIPVYFLCSMWGGTNRVAVSFKFFIYTFIGSLLMLVGLIFMYNATPTHSFDWESFSALGASLSGTQQAWLFALLFIAFAIKMPIFPFHTWQPDTYESSITPVTMVLSAVMVKMGLFAVIRWLLPSLPSGAQDHAKIVLILCVIGIVYASLLAMVQTNIKRLVAYSSIAHIGLMCAGVFSFNTFGDAGVGVQMFSHGINIIGMWVLVYFIEEKMGTKQLDKMGGLATVNPAFAIFLVIITLANVALPLTNGFVGEFLLFNGLLHATYLPNNIWNIVLTIGAGLGVILGAVYSLGMVQKVAYGQVANGLTKETAKLSNAEWVALSIITILIIVFGVYPQPILDLIK